MQDSPYRHCQKFLTELFVAESGTTFRAEVENSPCGPIVALQK